MVGVTAVSVSVESQMRNLSWDRPKVECRSEQSDPKACSLVREMLQILG
jgi:hypothetical protein